MENFSNEHGTDRKTHRVMRIADAITPLLLLAFQTDQSFPQALVSVAKRFRQAGG